MIKFKLRKKVFFSASLLLITILSVISVSCASVPNPQLYSSKKVNFIPSSTPYETIHNLEFSFRFNNSGGYKYNLNPDGKNPLPTDSDSDGLYSVFGTGWLFDWKLNSDQPDINGNINWTGYFGTNLHVADALLNPDDGIYTPLWLQGASTNTASFDKTINFSLGKYDNSNGPLSSTKRNTNLTYVTIGENKAGINTLPKTQFASIDFTNSKIKGYDSITKAIGLYSSYVDFAILGITIQFNKNTSSPKKDVWNYWIQPAMQTLKSLYPQDVNNSNLTYQKIFDPTSYVMMPHPNPGNVFIGGYPYSDEVKSPYLYGQNNLNGIKGSPIWTINEDKTSNVYQGHPIDINDAFGFSGDLTPNGFYNANSYLNFKLRYHGQEYKQYGIGYIVNDSNLAGGSSGSMGLINGNKLLGIYYGTLIDPKTKQESPIGLLEGLVMPEIPSNLTNLSKDKDFSPIYPYDLIGWTNLNTSIPNQNKSYLNSLQFPTYLFSNI